MPPRPGPPSLAATLPIADRIDAAALACVLLLPALAGLLCGAGLALIGPAEGAADSLDWLTLARDPVKLCYLGTAAAQLSRWIAERTAGGPGHPAWWRGDADDLPVPRTGVDPLAAWRPFPNGLDAAVLAFALTVLVNGLG